MTRPIRTTARAQSLRAMIAAQRSRTASSARLQQAKADRAARTAAPGEADLVFRELYGDPDDPHRNHYPRDYYLARPWIDDPYRNDE